VNPTETRRADDEPDVHQQGAGFAIACEGADLGIVMPTNSATKQLPR